VTAVDCEAGSRWPAARSSQRDHAILNLWPREAPHGHVAAVLGTLRAIGLDRILGPAGNRPRDLVIARTGVQWVIGFARRRF
jgi:hypothetical protein